MFPLTCCLLFQVSSGLLCPIEECPFQLCDIQKWWRESRTETSDECMNVTTLSLESNRVLKHLKCVIVINYE